MQGECAALFQHAQCLLDEHELILLRAYLVKDKIADDSIEIIIGKVELCRIPMLECAALRNALGGGVRLALCLSVVPHRRPVVDALHLCEREALCRCNRERARAAANVKRPAEPVPRQLIEQIRVDAPHEPATLEIKHAAAVVHIEDDDGRDAGENREDEEGRGHAVVYDGIECREHIEYGGDGDQRFHHRRGDPVAVVRLHIFFSFARDAMTASTSLLTSVRSSFSACENAASSTP